MEETKQFLDTFERVYFAHEYREVNLVANWMANKVLKSDMSYRWIDGDGLLVIAKSMIEIEIIQGRTRSINSNDDMKCCQFHI